MNIIELIRKARGKPAKYIIWKAYHLIGLQLEKRKYANYGDYFSFDDFCRECGFSPRQAELLSKRFLYNNDFTLYHKWDNPENIANNAISRFPDSRKQIIRDADEICDHVFDLLGSGPVGLGPKIDWHCDFKTGRRWSPMYYRDIDYNNLDEPSDVKVAWELARFQHFTVLGKAYLYTKDEKYASEFVSQWMDFVEENPVGMSINWACTMDVALRAISWIWAYHFFRHSPTFDLQKQARFLYNLACHGKFILRNLEYSDVNGNHYLSDGAGLVFLGLFLNFHPESKTWLNKGKEIIFGEIEKQVSTDGVDFEKSIPYHRLVMELFLDSVLLLEANDHKVPDGVMSRIEKMAEFVQSYIKPNGDIPLIGDADDGRMHILGNQEINDHRYLLSTCSARFARQDFKAAAGRLWEESYWKLSPEQLDIFDSMPAILPDISSKGFPDGGFFIIKAADDYMIIDCGDVGLAGRGGHGHNDILSFELYTKGITWFTDSGAYLYTASPEWRNRFRSSSFHNVLVIDGKEISRLGDSLWAIENDAKPVFKLFDDQDEFVVFVGGHTGYLRLPDPVMHYRGILYVKDSGLWVVIDRIECKGSHLIERMHQLPPGIEAQFLSDDSGIILSKDKKRSLLYDITRIPGHAKKEPSFMSRSYGKMVDSTRIIIEHHIEGNVDLTLVYAPINNDGSDEIVCNSIMSEISHGAILLSNIMNQTCKEKPVVS